jgi:hypothetical protein
MLDRCCRFLSNAHILYIDVEHALVVAFAHVKCAILVECPTVGLETLIRCTGVRKVSWQALSQSPDAYPGNHERITHI